MDNRAHVLGPLVLSTANQAGGAPAIDGCRGKLSGDHEGSWGGYLILPLRLWRVPRGERPPTRGLTIGWRGAGMPLAPRVWLRRLRYRVQRALGFQEDRRPTSPNGACDEVPGENQQEAPR